MKSFSNGYQKAFILYAILLVLAMPLMSLDHGTTWDEYKNHRYGQFLLDFYESFGAEQKALNYSNLYMYGGLFELTAEGAVELLNPLTKHNHTYAIRHVFNALAGFLAMLFTGLLAHYLGGWRCALIALLMISLSPRFLGHSMNNPKDIPFAAFFTMSLYFMVKVLHSFPKPAMWNIIWLITGIACTINVRVGGLLLICYLGFFLLLVVAYQFYLHRGHKPNPGFHYLKQGIVYGLLIALPAYFGGVLFWPYGLINPIVHPIETLLKFSDFSAILPVWFDGKSILSNELPWYYYPQSLAITTPLVVFTGLLAGVGYNLASGKPRLNGNVGVVVFALVFPLFYIILTQSTVYDGIRQVLFVYPLLVVLSSLGLATLFNLLRRRRLRIAYSLILAGLFSLPLTHIFNNYPHEYVFYNALIGGVEGAAGSYELDYWGNASKQLNRKLGTHLEKQLPPDSNVVIINNFVNPAKYMIKRYHANIQWKNITGGLPGDTKYHYAILIARWFPLKYFDNGKWPPDNTMFQATVDGVPVAVVLKQAKGSN